jgi:hypothetical protein
MPAESKAQQTVSPQYIAGFLDGEGNISILQCNRYIRQCSYQLHVGFTNRDLRPLQLIQAAYGGCLWQKRRYSSKHSQTYELRIGKRVDVGRLLTNLLPYLICKRDQAELGLAFLALGKVKVQMVGTRKIHPTKGGVYPIMKAVPGEQEKRAEIKSKLTVLNARGA